MREATKKKHRRFVAPRAPGIPGVPGLHFFLFRRGARRHYGARLVAPLDVEPSLMELRGRTVTVFGGAGFIGSVLVGLVARQGARVRVPVRDMVKGAHLRPLGEPGQVSHVLWST